jgi:hypothetical protein
MTTPSTTKLILLSRLKTFEGLSDNQIHAIQLAMIDYSAKMVGENQKRINKEAVKEALKLFPSLWKGDIVLWLRSRSFAKAKKHAQINANTENRPYYVIRKSNIAYLVQSSLEARNCRKRGIYDKKVNAIKLTETADFTAYPPIRQKSRT